MALKNVKSHPLDDRLHFDSICQTDVSRGSVVKNQHESFGTKSHPLAPYRSPQVTVTTSVSRFPVCRVLVILPWSQGQSCSGPVLVSSLFQRPHPSLQRLESPTMSKDSGTCFSQTQGKATILIPPCKQKYLTLFSREFPSLQDLHPGLRTAQAREAQGST